MSTEPQEAGVTGAGEQPKPVSPDVTAVLREQKQRRTQLTAKVAWHR